MSELGEAYVQIMPSTRGLGGNIKNALNSEAGDAGRSAGNSIVSSIKKVIAAAGIGKAVKDAMMAGGALEQSYGGLETIYGEAAEQAKEFAAAASAAGISANSYAEQAVSFGAALRQAYGGDMTSAMNAANTAIMDMADNSAKMGTDIGSIQAAYQGFAKQNYTMLDNLKLGYGGTKTEMERLLADAEKISGVKYDINNLGDVYDAIHVIQGELGLTGVAADEAKNTLTGSAAAMKASWQNVMAFMTSGEGDLGAAVSALGVNIGNFSKNAVRMLGNLAKSIPTLLQGIFSSIGPQLAPIASEILSGIVNGITTGLPKLVSGFGLALQSVRTAVTQALPELIKSGAEMLDSILSGMMTSLPQMARTATVMIPQIIAGVLNAIPQLLSAGSQIIENLASGLTKALPVMLSKAGNIIPTISKGLMNALSSLQTDGMTILDTLISSITQALPELMATGSLMITQLLESVMTAIPQLLILGSSILESLINGIMTALPGLMDTAAKLIPQMVTVITNSLPTILSTGMQLLMSLINGIISNLPQLISSAATIIAQLASGIASNLPTILESGITMLGELVAGVIQAIPDLIAAIPQIFSDFSSAMSGVDWPKLGKDIITGIIKGLWNAATGLFNAVRNIIQRALDSGEDEAEVNSPSKLFARELGSPIPEGVAYGVIHNQAYVDDAIDSMISHTVGDLRRFTMPGMATDTSTRIDYDRLAEAISERPVVIQGDTNRIFKVVRQENNTRTKATGYNALAAAGV